MALTLTIKGGDKLTIGNATVINRTKRSIKLSIEAPKDVPIKRCPTHDPKDPQQPYGGLRAA